MVPNANKLSAVAAGARFETQCARLLQSLRCALQPTSAALPARQSISHTARAAGAHHLPPRAEPLVRSRLHEGGGGPGDRGIDLAGVWHFVRAAPCAVVVQCKHWRAPIGSSAIRDFVGSVASIRANSTLLATVSSAQSLAHDRSQTANQSSAMTPSMVTSAPALSPISAGPVGIFMSSSRFTRDAVAAAHAATNVPLLLLHCCEDHESVDSPTKGGIDATNCSPRHVTLPRTVNASELPMPPPASPLPPPSQSVPAPQSHASHQQSSIPRLHVASLVMNAAAQKRLPHLGTARPRRQSHSINQPLDQTPIRMDATPHTPADAQMAMVVELVEHASNGACYRLQLSESAENGDGEPTDGRL